MRMNTSINVNGKQMRLPNVMEMNGKGYILKKTFCTVGSKKYKPTNIVEQKISINIQRTSHVMNELIIL